MSATHRRNRENRRRVTTWIAAGVGVAVVAALTTVATAANTYPTASDSFTRKVSKGLGTAPQGGRYTAKATKKTLISVNGGAAVVRFRTKGSAFAGTLPNTRIDDSFIRTSFRVSAPPKTGLGMYQSVIGRLSSGKSYRATTRVEPNGQMILWISRNDGSGTKRVDLARAVRVAGTVTKNTVVNLDFMITGNKPVALSARAWIRGTAMPDWQRKATDTSAKRLPHAGAVGIAAYLSGKSTTGTVRFYALKGVKPADEPTEEDDDNEPTPSPSPTPTQPTPTQPTDGPTTPPTDPPGVPDDRGSAPLGSTRYDVPDDALFVSPTGDDADNGTEEAPFRTVARALQVSTSGDTIVLREGSYHEFVSTSSSKRDLTIQNYPGEVVWFDGSKPVTTWKKSGSTWVSTGWTAEFATNASYVKGIDQSSSFVHPDYPMASHPDQVFVDGKQLKQVASAAKVTSGTFAVDYGSDTLTIGNDPYGKSVRASDLQIGVQLVSAGSKLQGVGIRRYGTQMAGAKGAVYVAGSGEGSTISNVVFEDNATQALSVIRPDVTVKNVTVRRAGLLGILATNGDRLVIRDSLVEYNNSEHFNYAPSAGGIKISRQRGFTATNNTVRNNINSMGIWTDESTVGIKITRNSVTDNKSVGVLLELSEDAIVADNIVSGNKTGIQAYNTGNVRIYNNYVGENWQAGVKLLQDQRRQANHATGRDKRQPIPDATNPWITDNVTVANNVFSGEGEYQFFAFDIRTDVSADEMTKLIAGNLFSERGSNNTMFAWGTKTRQLLRYQTTAALQELKGSAWKNATASSNALAAARPEAAASAPDNVALGLPNDVAQAIGQPAGSKRIGPYTVP